MHVCWFELADMFPTWCLVRAQGRRMFSVLHCGLCSHILSHGTAGMQGHGLEMQVERDFSLYFLFHVFCKKWANCENVFGACSVLW